MARSGRQRRRGAGQRTRQAELDLRIRQAQLRRRGRRIDLLNLVHLHGVSGPQWSVANLFGKVSEYAYAYHESQPHQRRLHPGQAIANGSHPCGIAVAQRVDSRRAYERYCVLPCHHGDQVLIPAAVPPIPAKARKIADAARADQEVAWVGVLYQPSEWMARQPDPAIVVEYFDLPGEYYALCVWGGDKSAIMEFVD